MLSPWLAELGLLNLVWLGLAWPGLASELLSGCSDEEGGKGVTLFMYIHATPGSVEM